MLKSQKILTRQSEIRQKLADVEFSEADDEKRKEVDALTAEFRENETEFRAALVLESEEREKLEKENPTEKPDEFRAACEAFSVVTAAQKLAEGKVLEGREAEVDKELEIRGMRSRSDSILLPWEALAPEVRADAFVTDATAKAGGFFARPQLTPVERVFETTSASQFGARILTVSGNPRLPELTAGASAGWVGDGSGKDSETITVAAHTPEVHSLTARYAIDRQALIAGGMPESLLRADMAMALMEGLDKAFWAGSGSSNQPQGLKAALSASAVGAKVDIGDVLKFAVDDANGAGLTVSNMPVAGGNVGGRVCFAMHPTLFALIQEGTASGVKHTSDMEALAAFGIKMVASKHVDSVSSASNNPTGLFSHAKDMGRSHANICQWGAPELIRDPGYGKGGRVILQMFLFADLMFTQKTTRFKLRTVHTS